MRRIAILAIYTLIVLSCTSYQRWVEQQRKLTVLGEKYRKIYYGIECIATEDELDEFLGLNTDENREEFLRRFWKRRDPTPTTEKNERKLEHERRVKYAEQQHFKGVGSEFWDDRGKIYIKYGEPDWREVHVEKLSQAQPRGVAVLSGRNRQFDVFEGATKPFEKWYYYRYGLRFDFVEENNIYRLVADAEIQCSASARTTPGRLLASVSMDKLTEFHEQPKEAPLEKYEPKYEGKHLESLLNIATFKDKEGKDRVELYYGVPY